jgi:hypothetical protein
VVEVIVLDDSGGRVRAQVVGLASRDDQDPAVVRERIRRSVETRTLSHRMMLGAVFPI